MNRRDFLFTFGIGSTVAIAGYFLFDPVPAVKSKDDPVSSDQPRLKSNVRLKVENDLYYLTNGTTSCFVNETGQQIISYMDGNNTVLDITHKISEIYSVEYSDFLVASVACFVSELAIEGFLQSPFYATFYENYA
jgi:hypothetical protein